MYDRTPPPPTNPIHILRTRRHIISYACTALPMTIIPLVIALLPQELGKAVEVYYNPKHPTLVVPKRSFSVLAVFLILFFA